MHQGTQPGLFDLPLAATADPASSHAAAAEATRSGRAQRHREVVLRLVKAHPDKTAVELFSLQTGPDTLGRHEISRRLADLKNLGLVEQGAPRKCSVNGTAMVTWRAR